MDDKRINVLLIEDDVEYVSALNDVLLSANGSSPKFTFRRAQSLQEGTLELKKNPVDVVLLDLSLPDGRGAETLAWMQSQAKDVPVVVLTGLNDDTSAIKAVSKGAQDYLVKTHLNHYVFIRTVLHAIERHKIIKQLDSVSSALRSTNAQLERLVFLDPLTELLNRRGMEAALSREIQWLRRDDTNLIAVILDLDDFKRVNDALGHAVGDVVLKEIAQKIKGALRVTDYVARIGGDEFLILLPKTRFMEGLHIAEKLRLAISKSNIALSLKESLTITASLGLLHVTEEIVSMDELIARSHLSLHRSKRNGKNTLSYGTSADEISHPLNSIIEALRHRDQYRVVKQPIFDLQKHQATGYEFLSRMKIKGFEMPDDFFRLCLENKILTLVDYHCLKNCLEQAAALPGDMRCHVNLFPSTIIDMPSQLLQLFPQKPKGAYCIEISEQQIIGDPSYLSDAVNGFKRAGVLIAIDDVGFGQSCLESLIVLEPDIVKIDKKWVNGISKNAWARSSLKRLLKVAEALGAEVVAEGIEQPEDLELLKELGVVYGQGYLLGKPA